MSPISTLNKSEKLPAEEKNKSSSKGWCRKPEYIYIDTATLSSDNAYLKEPITLTVAGCGHDIKERPAGKVKEELS